MKFVLLFITVLNVLMFVNTSADLTRNDGVIQEFLDEVYSSPKKSKEKMFMRIMWSKITSIFPESVPIPGCEDVTRRDTYACTTETYMWPKLGEDVVWSPAALPHKNKLQIDIDAPLEFTKPLSFEFTMKTPSGYVVPRTPVSHVFDGINTVKIELEIPDFTQERNKINLQCLVEIKSIRVSKLGESRLSLTKSRNGYDRTLLMYYRGITNDQFRYMFTLGLIKGVVSRLEKASWLCASKELINRDNKRMKDYQYTQHFHEYCGEKKLEN